MRGRERKHELSYPQSECVQQRREVVEWQEGLQVARQRMISALQSSVFPVEVEPLSVDDAGEEGET